MRRALAYEWRRVTGVRGTWVVLGLGVLASVGGAAAYAGVVWMLAQDGYRVSVVEAMVVTVTKPQLTPVAGGLLALVTVTGDRRHLTALCTYLVEPRRHRVLVATLAVVTALTVAVTAASALGAVLVSRLVLGDVARGAIGPAALLLATGGLLLACLGWVAWGVAVGHLVRSPVAGLLLLLGVPFVAERVVRAAATALGGPGSGGLAPLATELAAHLPFASAAALQAAPRLRSPVVLAGSPDPWLAAAVFLGFVGGCLLLAVHALRHSDLGTAA